MRKTLELCDVNTLLAVGNFDPMDEPRHEAWATHLGVSAGSLGRLHTGWHATVSWRRHTAE